jgi:hypothetical protein
VSLLVSLRIMLTFVSNFVCLVISPYSPALETMFITAPEAAPWMSNVVSPSSWLDADGAYHVAVVRETSEYCNFKNLGL